MATDATCGVLSDIDYDAVGRRVKQLRRQRRITQAGLAGLAGISTSFCGHIERGTRIPSLLSVVRIAAVLDVTVDALLYGLPQQKGPHRADACKMRVLNDMMRVLYEYAEEWMPAE